MKYFVVKIMVRVMVRIMIIIIIYMHYILLVIKIAETTTTIVLTCLFMLQKMLHEICIIPSATYYFIFIGLCSFVVFKLSSSPNVAFFLCSTRNQICQAIQI